MTSQNIDPSVNGNTPVDEETRVYSPGDDFSIPDQSQMFNLAEQLLNMEGDSGNYIPKADFTWDDAIAVREAVITKCLEEQGYIDEELMTEVNAQLSVALGGKRVEDLIKAFHSVAAQEREQRRGFFRSGVSQYPQPDRVVGG